VAGYRGDSGRINHRDKDHQVSNYKSWDPAWGTLPPAPPVDRNKPADPVVFTHEEIQRRKKLYRDTHEKPVLEGIEKRREEP
jgi:hypothetical protein